MTETLLGRAGFGDLLADRGMPSPFITSLSHHGHLGLSTLSAPAMTSAAYIAVNMVLYAPFSLQRSIVVKRFFWANGTTASTNNCQVGVYDKAGNAIKIGTATLASGTSAPQFDNIADFVLSPGTYFMAFWCNGTTTHILRNNGIGTRSVQALGWKQQASVATTMPTTTATFATVANSYVCLFGLDLRGTP